MITPDTALKRCYINLTPHQQNLSWPHIQYTPTHTQTHSHSYIVPILLRSLWFMCTFSLVLLLPQKSPPPFFCVHPCLLGGHSCCLPKEARYNWRPGGMEVQEGIVWESLCGLPLLNRVSAFTKQINKNEWKKKTLKIRRKQTTPRVVVVAVVEEVRTWGKTNEKKKRKKKLYK